MARPRQPGLTENELDIMNILWEDHPLKVSAILKKLTRRPRPAYTSLLTVVQAMEKKGYVQHFEEGKAFTYAPVLKKSSFTSMEVRRMAKRLFGGGAGSLAINLVKNEKLSDEEIVELKRLLEEK